MLRLLKEKNISIGKDFLNSKSMETRPKYQKTEPHEIKVLVEQKKVSTRQRQFKNLEKLY